MNDQYAVHMLPMPKVHADANFNCRGAIPTSEIVDLARDIKNRKLDVPITVQPFTDPKLPGVEFRVVAGHRRFEAFRYNILMKVPGSDVIPAFIRHDLDEMGARQLNLRENLHRKNLNVLQEAKALQFFLRQKGPLGAFLFTDAELAELFGQSRGWVQNRRDLLKLPAEIQAAAASDLLTADQIRQLARMTSDSERFELVRKIKDAKARGEKLDITPSVTRASDIHKMRDRRGVEVEEMGGIIYDILGPNIATRFSAWSRGIISTVVLLDAVKAECKDRGIPYKQPDFLRRALTGAA